MGPAYEELNAENAKLRADLERAVEIIRQLEAKLAAKGRDDDFNAFSNRMAGR